MRPRNLAARRPARLGLVDDHATIGLGLRALLAPVAALELVAIAPTVPALLAKTRELDLVLLDLRLADGSEVAQNVRLLQVVSARVLIFTSGENPAMIREAARSGAVGMLRKSEDPATIVRSLVAALRGDVVATTDWAAALDGDPRLRDAKLSPRESEVLALYAAGEQADRVAESLGISRETVLDHVRRIRAKYAGVERPAPTKIDLYRRALEDGVLRDGQ